MCSTITALLALSLTNLSFAQNQGRFQPSLVCSAKDYAALKGRWVKPLKGLFKSGQLQVADKKLIESVKGVIDQELLSYPSGMIKKNLKRIALAGNIEIDGIQYGGTYCYQTIVVDLEPEMAKDQEWVQELKNTIHHEFSTVLYYENRKRFPMKKWKATLPQGFKYLGDGIEAILQGKADAKLGRSDLYKQGFLNEYSKASFDEDFNVIAETAMAKPELMKKVVLKHPKIKTKYLIWLDFMRSIDDAFTAPFAMPTPMNTVAPSEARR